MFIKVLRNSLYYTDNSNQEKRPYSKCILINRFLASKNAFFVGGDGVHGMQDLSSVP